MIFLFQNDMIDFVFAVDNPLEWHKANMQTNHKHYSFIKYAGAEFIKNVQENFGAKMYFNTLVEVENRVNIAAINYILLIFFFL